MRPAWRDRRAELMTQTPAHNATHEERAIFVDRVIEEWLLCENHVTVQIVHELRAIRRILMQLQDVIDQLNANTNAVAARLDKLQSELAAGDAPTAAQLSELQAISDHLKAMGADPAAPVPPLAPAAAAPAAPDPAATTPGA